MKKTTMLMAVLAVGAGMLISTNVDAFSRIYQSETNNYKKNTQQNQAVDGVVESFGRNSNQRWNENDSRNSIAERMRLYWSRKNRTAADKYTYNQKLRNMWGQKSINVNGESTLINRSGEIQDREGIRQKDMHRVEAVNPKAVFVKRAKDYYINGGYALPDRTTMSRGNKNGETMRARRAWYFSPEYMQERGFISYVAKDPLRDLNSWEKKVGAGQQSMYNYLKQNSGFGKVGITPYTIPMN